MKAVAYIRVSTDRAEQADSLENQKAIFLNHIKEKGYEFQDFYVDIETGTSDKNRPELEKLINDAQDNKFDVIIAKELSRLSRNAEISYKLKRLCETYNVSIVTLDGALDTTSSKNDNTMFGLYAWIYEQESQRISNRIKSVFKSKYKNGEYLCSTPPYGYKKTPDKKLIVKTDNTPEVIKLIFEKFQEDWGYDKIARFLDKEGYKTPAQVLGKKNAGIYWHGSTIKKLLKNPVYAGDLVQHRETGISVVNKKRRIVPEEERIVVKNCHEAIIDKESFNRVQQIIATRERKGRGKVKNKKNLFTNFLFCADCGTGLWHKQTRKSYLCGKYYKHGKRACSNHEIKENELKEIILSDIRLFASDITKNKFIKLAHKNAEKILSVNKKKYQQIENDIRKIENNKDKLLDLLTDEIITVEDYKRKVAQSGDQLKSLRIKKEELESQIKHSPNPNLNEDISKLIEEVLNFNDLNREMLSKLVDRIEISENGELIIFYKFSAPLSHLKELARKRAI